MKFKIESILLLILFAILFTSCESKPERPMVVSTNLWIGYSPLYYAEEKGWLRENNIKLVRTVSLAESMKTFESAASDMLCGTKYEIDKVSQGETEQGNLILLDRSNGGDYVLGNRSIDELKLEKRIDVYLEVESVNAVLLEFFMKKYALKSSQITMIDSSQVINAKLHMKRNATIIVTYDPYNIALEKQGYKVLGSTKEDELLVIDAIYAPQKTQQQFTKEIDRLNFLIFESLKALDENPKEYFEKINSYYDYSNFNEFKAALDSIKWIYSDHSVVVEKRKEQSSDNHPKLIKAYRE